MPDSVDRRPDGFTPPFRSRITAMPRPSA